MFSSNRKILYQIPLDYIHKSDLCINLPSVPLINLLTGRDFEQSAIYAQEIAKTHHQKLSY